MQKVLKGISGLTEADADGVLEEGVICNWWRKTGRIAAVDIPRCLTEENLNWHQNRYDEPDPRSGNEPFGQHSPFISTTGGTAEIDHGAGIVDVYPARDIAIDFATDGWTGSGYVFRCYLFVIGKRAVAHQPFGEELRDLHVYTRYTAYHNEGEVTAKILIPPAQIEAWEFYDINDVRDAVSLGRPIEPSKERNNSSRYVEPQVISNIRETI